MVFAIVPHGIEALLGGAAVEDFSGPHGPVAVIVEMLGQVDAGVEGGGGLELMAVVVDAGGGGQDAGENGGTCGVAGGCGAVGVGEEHGLGSEAVEVGGFGVGDAVEEDEVVVHVVEDEEQDVGFLGGGGEGGEAGEGEQADENGDSAAVGQGHGCTPWVA